MRNAFLAGTAIAAASGLVGYFVVLRSQVFSADALEPRRVHRRARRARDRRRPARRALRRPRCSSRSRSACSATAGRANDVVIGTVFTWILGLGVLFLSIYTTSASAANGAANVNVLFGSIFGLGAAQAVVAALIGVGAVHRGRRASRGRCCSRASTRRWPRRAGLPVRALGVAFLVLVGVCAAEATQAVGALLLVGLIAGPAGAAQPAHDPAVDRARGGGRDRARRRCGSG